MSVREKACVKQAAILVVLVTIVVAEVTHILLH